MLAADPTADKAGRLATFKAKQSTVKQSTDEAGMRAVNARGGLGTRGWDVVKAEQPEVSDVFGYHMEAATHSEPIGDGILVAKLA